MIQKENPGVELGCTNQFGAIWYNAVMINPTQIQQVRYILDRVAPWSRLRERIFCSSTGENYGNNGGNSGIEDILTQDASDFGILYKLQGISNKNNVELGKWDGLNSGIYIWRNENKTYKIINP